MKNAKALVLSIIVGAALPAAVASLFLKQDLRWGEAMARANAPLRVAERMVVVAHRSAPEEVAVGGAPAPASRVTN